MASTLQFTVLLFGLCFGANVMAKCGKQTDPDCCETCPSGWTQFGRRCFMFHDNGKDWADAERYCTIIEGNLASLRTKEEYVFLRELIHRVTNSHESTWVGGYDAVKEGTWLWSDGAQFLFTDWAKGEPNNNNGEHCMEMNFHGQDYVNDANCLRKKSFLCSKDLSPA